MNGLIHCPGYSSHFTEGRLARLNPPLSYITLKYKVQTFLQMTIGPRFQSLSRLPQLFNVLEYYLQS